MEKEREYGRGERGGCGEEKGASESIRDGGGLRNGMQGKPPQLEIKKRTKKPITPQFANEQTQHINIKQITHTI